MPANKIKPWIYGPDRHVLIQNIVLSGWDLYTHDLLVTCGRGADDAKWQHLSITPCQDGLLCKLKPEIQEQIEVEATTLFDGALLKKFKMGSKTFHVETSSQSIYEK